MSGLANNRQADFYYRCRASYGDIHLTQCREKSVRTDKADTLVWEWLTGLLCDAARLKKGLREMSERRENELQPKRARLEAVGELVTKKESAIYRLAQAIARADDETVVRAIEEQLKATSRERAALRAERDILAADVASHALTADDEAVIISLAEKIRQQLSSQPTFEEKRKLLDLLDVRVKLQHNADQRELYVMCGLNLTGQALSIESHLSRRARGI